jgi:hypothetical protein
VPDKVFVDDLGKHQRHMQCLVAAMVPGANSRGSSSGGVVIFAVLAAGLR